MILFMLITDNLSRSIILLVPLGYPAYSPTSTSTLVQAIHSDIYMGRSIPIAVVPDPWRLAEPHGYPDISIV
jgi:hypothetical protein